MALYYRYFAGISLSKLNVRCLEAGELNELDTWEGQVLGQIHCQLPSGQLNPRGHVADLF